MTTGATATSGARRVTVGVATAVGDVIVAAKPPDPDDEIVTR